MPKREILIVDREVPGARELQARLAGLGYEVAAIASSVGEADALIEAARPDLVLMDAALGAEIRCPAAAGELRLQWPLPVVFITTQTDDERQQPVAPGVMEPDDHLVKPFTDLELRVVIELALCRHEAVREARELDHRFFAASIDMLCFLDFNGYFKRLNPAWERTLGFTREELMSRPFIEFVHPDDRERTLRKNAEVRGGGQSLAFENRYLCKDGSFRWLLWNAVPDSVDRVIYSVARDITERKQAEDERERLVSQLQAALTEVRALREILPICSYCRKIRDDENYWLSVEGYISRHTNTRFSHGICPSCMATEVTPLLGK